MTASDHLNGDQFGERLTLYRGEGNHDKPSPYYGTGPDRSMAGGWWTSDLQNARRYAASMPGGKVYVNEVHPSEAVRRGMPHNYFIEDQAVRDRRRLYTED